MQTRLHANAFACKRVCMQTRLLATAVANAHAWRRRLPSNASLLAEIFRKFRVFPEKRAFLRQTWVLRAKVLALCSYLRLLFRPRTDLIAHLRVKITIFSLTLQKNPGLRRYFRFFAQNCVFCAKPENLPCYERFLTKSAPFAILRRKIKFSARRARGARAAGGNFFFWKSRFSRQKFGFLRKSKKARDLIFFLTGGL